MSNELKFLIKLVKEASLLVNDKFEVKEKKGELVGDLVTNYDYEIEKYSMDLENDLTLQYLKKFEFYRYY